MTIRHLLVATLTGTAVLAPNPARAADLPNPIEIVRDGITLRYQSTPVATKPVTGKGPTKADFDGDGRDDVASLTYSGLAVSYSSAPHRDLAAKWYPGGAEEDLGAAMAVGNFNGDRYDDLAVGDGWEPDLRNMGYQVGGVWVIPGGPGGLQFGRAQHLTQNTPGLPGTPVRGDLFGFSLAAGDITGDGRDELAIGIPDKKIGTRKNAGAVVVLKGAPSGVTTTGARWISQATAGVPGAATADAEFGYDLAIGRIDKNRHAELVVAARADLGDQGGWITQFWGAASGVSLKKVSRVSGEQLTDSVNQRNVYLWASSIDLAIGDINRDGYGELVAGLPGAQVGMEVQAGAVVTIPGRATGLSAKGAIAITQRTAGVATAPKDDEYFGDTVAVGDVTGDGRADVLTSAPGEWARAGAIVLLRGTAKGLTGAKSQFLTQSSTGVPDTAERDDEFGRSLALLNLNGTGGLDALAGAPQEEVTGDTPGYGSGSITRFLGGYQGLGNATVVNGRFLNELAAGYGAGIAG
ncbi:FG-GAP and VCBS repeat-containing protein [Actinoplanes flavus]|uniref:VCBS repeat-containing protein n=1 Tax=Actinoplanes flavus TaxID=2820290 RepID=A0ABS3UMT4_9ACTN|nr:FG-GAP and VCBS repeat-containing protein [Actinoplanes flavus]MBO3740099.1 VCBS repeat-containing protein [Actinoplanes flavus]